MYIAHILPCMLSHILLLYCTYITPYIYIYIYIYITYIQTYIFVLVSIFICNMHLTNYGPKKVQNNTQNVGA
jgi:hypothetical protein